MVWYYMLQSYASLQLDVYWVKGMVVNIQFLIKHIFGILIADKLYPLLKNVKNEKNL